MDVTGIFIWGEGGLLSIFHFLSLSPNQPYFLQTLRLYTTPSAISEKKKNLYHQCRQSACMFHCMVLQVGVA